MKVHTCDQRSDEWMSLRLGKLTGSRAADMLATVKSGESASRRNLRVQLALERLTGRSHERVVQTQAMKDGVDREADACALYEGLTGNLIQATGFIEHDDLQAGCSLDGHFGQYEGVVEIKCPTPGVHLEYLRSGKVPYDYLQQVVHALWITGAEWCDWLSYQPDFPEGLRVKLVRVPRVEAAIEDYERKAKAFLAEVDSEVDTIESLRAVSA